MIEDYTSEELVQELKDRNAWGHILDELTTQDMIQELELRACPDLYKEDYDDLIRELYYNVLCHIDNYNIRRFPLAPLLQLLDKFFERTINKNV